MKVAFAKPALPKKGAVVVSVAAGRKLHPGGMEVDKACKGALTRAMAGSRFTGKDGELLSVLAPPGLDVAQVVLLGYGEGKQVDEAWAERMGGSIYAHLASSGVEDVAVWISPPKRNVPGVATRAARVASGALLRSYRFDKYRTREKPEDKPSVKRFTVMVEEAAAARKAFQPLQAVADGVFLARDLVSEPGNVLNPETYAERMRDLAEHGIDVEVLGEKQMEELGMRTLLAVGRGSEHESKLVVMRWMGAPKDEPPVAFVGKGVTFDTGGISIKPAGGMEEMKFDMGGSAAVVGLMRALAGRGAKANVVGVIGLVENMPDAKAQRPGDVVKSMSGQTVEVINTDAEGRLVLADALWYTKERFKPRYMVDLATLTGAMIIALGNENAGLFASDDTLADRLLQAARETGEGLWRMPLGDAYDKLLKSDIADMKNVGGRPGGSITAAQFLKRFVGDVPWAHLDIAGTAWTAKDSALVPKGATAYGVRLLDRLVAGDETK